MVRKDKDCIYPFGLDPVWYRSAEEVQYLNGLKMKTAVIFGVAQMLLGTCLKILNSIYFKRWVEMIFVGFAQLVMMCAMFGFMDYLIIMKWLTDWDPVMAEDKEPPGIINVMVAMFLSGGEVPDGAYPVADVITDQASIMKILLLLILICVPSMLLVEPIYEFNAAKKSHVQPSSLEMSELDPEKMRLEPSESFHASEETENDVVLKQFRKTDDDSHGFGDFFIHSMIETIEYALGTVSNTASYLRLWALSLAHSQLAKVFFDLTILGFLKEGNYLLLFLSYYCFFGVTFAVLMCMDLLECFLHTLRLHWVEFQNKFYKGGGEQF
jgi:V-type H+-transporting ATPase subunit a